MKRISAIILAAALFGTALAGCGAHSGRSGMDEIDAGIEASAFTDIEYAGAGMPQDRAEMILDRPFIYIIRDSYCGRVPVFMGICENPAEKQGKTPGSAAEKLRSAPEITLQDALSSAYQPISVQSGNYSWNYRDDENEEQMVSLVACGTSPLDSNARNTIVHVPDYKRLDAVTYSLSCPVEPDSITVKEWDADSEEASLQEGSVSKGADTKYITLKPDKIYEIVLDWGEDNLDERGFYGQANYVVKTTGPETES